MDFLKKLFNPPADDAVDYYREGVELLGAGRYHEALTSFRLALRESPGDAAVLQQIAIAHTRIGMTDEAVKVYRQVLDRDRTAMGAHYGLAFLLLREGRREEAVEHLRRFLERPPELAEAQRHVEHARATLSRLEGEEFGER
ncbi:MAG: tetratricopeptide repeat protein [Gemmatimonadota bacterium]